MAPGTPGAPGTRPEDNKDSPEYKKKQAMAAGPVLNLDWENSQSYSMHTSLFTSLKDIFEAVIAHQSRIGVVSPNKFLEVLRRENEMFRTPMHQDAHEFLNLLLNEVVENVEQFSKQMPATIQNGNAVESAAASTEVAAKSNVTNSGWVHELFEGTLTSETRCLTCENTSQRDEPFIDLSVDLDQHSSVTSCLRKFSEEEMLCERNKFHCDKCGGLQEAEKRMKIKRLPRILALHLKRFKYTEDLRRLQKLFHRVVYPYYLRLFNTTDDAEDPDRLYELYAVVVHIGGGPYHGHYVSIIKTQDRGWLLFDDEMVEPVDKAYVRNFFGGENVLACAYVLFYQETTLEAMQKEQEAEAAAAAKASEQATASANGVTANGHGHHFPLTPVTPMHDDTEQFASLDHAATAPPVTPKSAPIVTNGPAPPTPDPITRVGTTPSALPNASTTTTSTAAATEPNPSAVTVPIVATTISKAERKAQEKERKAQERAQEKERKAQEKEQEKERKAAEKEQEKQLIAKRREIEKRRQENHRKQEEELRAAIAASKVTKAEEDRKAETESGTATPATQVQNGVGTAPPSTPGAGGVAAATHHHGGVSSLTRFRQSSIGSLRHKPKFLSGKKDKEESVAGSTAENEATAVDAPAEKKEKGKNRFSLGRKKSTAGLK
jgi:ubiquitin carboxyl-terminal hydrolase 9/13